MRTSRCGPDNVSGILTFFAADRHPVTALHYYPGKQPVLDVYAGRVVKSHPMPPDEAGRARGGNDGMNGK